MRLTVYTQGGEETEIEAPADMMGYEFISELAQALELPARDAEGRPVSWRLDNQDTGRTLDPGISLLASGVLEGHRLSLMREVTAGGGDIIHGITQVLALVASSGVAAGAYNLLKSWIDAKNGRKLRLKVGDIEVEATQMREEDVLRLLALLRENAEQKKIRDLLLEAAVLPPDRPKR